MRTRKKRRSTTKAKKPDGLLSVNALAEKTGLDRRTLKKYLADVEPAKVKGRNRFYRYDEVLEVILRRKSEEAATDWKGEKGSEEIRKLKIANDAKEGKLVPRDAVQASIGRVLAKIDTILEQKLCNEYPSAVASMDIPQARIYGKRLGDQIRDEIKALGDQWKN